MRGKIVKQARRIAKKHATSYNDFETREGMKFGGVNFSTRVLQPNSERKLLKRIKQLLDNVPHHMKRSVMNTLTLGDDGFFVARMR